MWASATLAATVASRWQLWPPPAANRGRRRRSRDPAGACRGALESALRGEPTSGGAPSEWSPEGGRRRWSAAVSTVLRREACERMLEKELGCAEGSVAHREYDARVGEVGEGRARRNR
jgi:hypothetical protein